MSKKMSPLRRDGYKAGMIMMLIALSTMLLTTACSSEDDLVNNTAENTVTSKGYALPVTVNVTRGGDATTRATFDGSKLNFSTGDKLFVRGNYDHWTKMFAGTLDYDAESGKFKGTIYTQDDTYKTYEDLFGNSDNKEATLLPAGYEDHGYLVINTQGTEEKYDDLLVKRNEYTLATSKADGVAQFSNEQSLSYNDGFALSPDNAILNFTITGLAASTNVAVSLTSIAYNITGTVTTDASGNATFAAGIMGGINLQQFSLQFSVSSTDKVYFSKGNLQYTKSTGIWSFMDHQYDYYATYSADAWDKFGWSTSATTYGMSTSTSNDDYSGNFVDWGATMGTGWFTLSKAEWEYLFNTRSASTVGGTSNGRYAKAKVNDVQGIILFPDTYTHPDGVTAPTGVNATDDTGWNGNSYTVADWTKMESAGCVFLPAAGYRNGSSMVWLGTNGNYWCATRKDAENAYGVDFSSNGLYPALFDNCHYGYSVRLVREVPSN